MSRGPGAFQRELLDSLARGEVWQAAVELARAAGRSGRQTTAALRSLEARGLIYVQHGAVRYISAEPGWDWVGARPTNEERRRAEVLAGLGLPDVVRPGAQRRRRYEREDRPVPGLLAALVERADREQAELEHAVRLTLATGIVHGLSGRATSG